MPDYVPDFSHFVSLWDLVLAQTWKQVGDPKKVSAVDGRHFLAVDSINDYAFYDYETHVHPLLVMFTDVNFTSGQTRNAAGGADTHEAGIVIKGKIDRRGVAGDDFAVDGHANRIEAARRGEHGSGRVPPHVSPFNFAHFGQHQAVRYGPRDRDVHEDRRRWHAGSHARYPGGNLGPRHDVLRGAERHVLRDDLKRPSPHTDTVMKVEPVSAHKMRQPSAAASDFNDGAFFIAITDFTEVEWVKCTKNDKLKGELTVERGQFGTTRRAWDADTTLIAGGGGHKKYDARTHMNKLARGARGAAHIRIFDRLRLP